MREKSSYFFEYLGYFIIELILALACLGSTFNTIHTSFFIALMSARRSAIVLAIMHLALGIAVTPTIMNIVVTIVSTLVILSVRLLFDRMRWRINIIVTMVSTLVSLVPVLVYSVLDISILIHGIMTIVLTTIFTYLCTVAVFTVVVKRLRYRLGADEIFALLAVLALSAIGVMNINIYGYELYYTIMSLLVLLVTSILGTTPAMLIALAYGLGGGIMRTNLELAGAILVMTAFSALFMRYNRYFSIVSIVAIDMTCGVYFHSFGEYHYLHIIAVAVGTIIYLLIPRSRIKYLHTIYSTSERSTALVSFINRNRIDIGARITNLAMLFGDIERAMTGGEYILTQKAGNRYISEAIMCETCAECRNRDVCYSALGGDTLAEIEPIVSRAMAGKATRADAGVFLESRCQKIGDIVSRANDYATRYARTSVHICDVLDNKRILGEQIGSLGKVLATMSDGLLEGVGHNAESEARIMEEMNMAGVVCNDVLFIERRDGSMDITLVVRERDKAKRVIRDILERLTRVRLDSSEDRVCEIEGFVTLRFTPMARYRLSYGVATRTEEGSASSGDSRSIVRISHDRVAVVLCDGKGSGERATENSNNTIGIIEKMYKAGFESDMILSFANSVLSIRNSEDFSALDMAVVSLRDGTIDCIKLGGVATYIKRQSSIDVVEGSALPLGIIEGAEPSIERRSLSEGDIVLVVSDGVTDSLGDRNIRNILINYTGSNVQQLADEIAMRASEGGAIDDVTAITFKLTRVL